MAKSKCPTCGMPMGGMKGPMPPKMPPPGMPMMGDMMGAGMVPPKGPLPPRGPMPPKAMVAKGIPKKGKK